MNRPLHHVLLASSPGRNLLIRQCDCIVALFSSAHGAFMKANSACANNARLSFMHSTPCHTVTLCVKYPVIHLLYVCTLHFAFTECTMSLSKSASITKNLSSRWRSSASLNDTSCAMGTDWNVLLYSVKIYCVTVKKHDMYTQFKFRFGVCVLQAT